MKKLIAANIVAAFCATNAHAFGIGDIVNIGIQAGGELVRAAGGKAVDAIKESMRDPEAEARKKEEQERKLAEQMQKQIDEIEQKPNLRPIERERLVLKLKQAWQASKEMQAFIERAEAQRKAERDKLFTLGGIAEAVGRAALSSPSMAIAQADLMTKDPIWRAQQRLNNEAIFRQADAQVAAGIPQAKARLALAQADVLQKTGVQQAGAEAVIRVAEEMAQQGVNKEDAEKVADAAGQASVEARNADSTAAQNTSAAPGDAQPGAASDHAAGDAFSPDLGRKLYVEFVGSPKETQRLRELLAGRGHVIVDRKDDADVAYLIEGEYAIPETKQHQGVTVGVGELLEDPTKPIAPPEKKLMGSIGAGISKFFLAAAAAQGQPVPMDAMPKDGVFRQEVLLVIARQPKDGKETRASVVQTVDSATIEAAKLSKVAKDDLYTSLGI